MENKTHLTSCTMDCPDTCLLEIQTSNGRIRKISGSKKDHITNGFICSKIAQFDKRIYHKDRLKYPLHRIGKKGSAQFERISWNNAIRIISYKFEEIINKWGGEAILPYHYGGSNGLLGDGFIDDYFFSKIGASRISRTLCAVPTTLVAQEMYGKMPGVAFDDYAQAKFILIWGANPKKSNIHLVPFLKQAKKNGAFIAVIDPLNNFSHSEVDINLPVLPGTDLVVALSMINYFAENKMIENNFIENYAINTDKLLDKAAAWSFQKAAEVAGVGADQIKFIADKYAEISPAVIRCGWGLERNRNGGQAVAAILALPALMGKFKVKSGGYTMSNSGGLHFNKKQVLGNFTWNSRVLNMTRLAEILTGNLNPPIKGLYVYNCNPVVTVPEQDNIIKGLLRDDLFTVVHEQVMTDTAHYADIVLPVVTFPEQYEIKKSYGNYVLAGVKPVIAAAGESKPNEEVFALMAQAMGFDDSPFQWNSGELVEKITSAMQLDKNLIDGGQHKIRFKGHNPVQFKNVFPGTADGTINLVPDILGSEPYKFLKDQSGNLPLALVSPASGKMITSTMGEYNFDKLFVLMHPRDAHSRKISNGDKVKVYNTVGEVHCYLKISDKIRSGVVMIPKGAWRKSSLNGKTSVALCGATLQVVGGAACYNDARVDVEKLS